MDGWMDDYLDDWASRRQEGSGYVCMDEYPGNSTGASWHNNSRRQPFRACFPPYIRTTYLSLCLSASLPLYYPRRLLGANTLSMAAVRSELCYGLLDSAVSPPHTT